MTTANRDWMLVYIREGEPAYWVASDGEIRTLFEPPSKEEWAAEMEGYEGNG